MNHIVRIGDIAEQVRGVSYAKGEASATPREGYIAILRAGNIAEHGLDIKDLVYVPAHRVSSKQRLRRNDVLIAASSGSIEVVGKAARVDEDLEAAFGAFCKVLRPSSHVNPTYFAHYFRSQDYRRHVSAVAAGININNLRNQDLDDLVMPLPSIDEQRWIANVLDKVDSVRAKRRAVLAQLDELSQSIFLEMFGDAAINPKRWGLRSLGSLASKFSDGPFGSNLKSDHYQPEGVRVIRLQNIGVGEFLDDDRAYISQEHFHRLRKHECRPGDLLIATLGDPNIRACIQPLEVPIALNKADCVQMRVNPGMAHPTYVCALLNQRSLGAMAHSLMRGQTRVRVSMGRLRELAVPVPPLSTQCQFATRIKVLIAVRRSYQVALSEFDALFASLQHRAFNGTLRPEPQIAEAG